MCVVEKCDRHEIWGGRCLPHLKEHLEVVDATTKPKRKSRKKKIDAEEILVNDETTEMEVRTNESRA